MKQSAGMAVAFFGGGGMQRILVVEDDLDIQELLKSRICAWIGRWMSDGRMSWVRLEGA